MARCALPPKTVDEGIDKLDLRTAIEFRRQQANQFLNACRKKGWSYCG